MLKEQNMQFPVKGLRDICLWVVSSATVDVEHYRPSSWPPALSVCSHWPSAALSSSAQVLPAQPVVSVVTLAASAVPRGVEPDVRPSGVW